MRKYAEALLKVAAEAGAEGEIGREIRLAAELLKDSPQLICDLENPLLTSQEKRDLIFEGIGGELSAETLRFLFLLAERGRIKCLKNICDEYERLSDASHNVTTVAVRTPQPLAPHLKEGLIRALEEYTGGGIILEEGVDPSLIGGAAIRVGDQIFDATIKGEINRMLNQMNKSINKKVEAIITLIKKNIEDYDTGDTLPKVSRVTVKTAFPMKEEAQKRLLQAMESYLGRKVNMKISVDRGLIGGLTIQVDDKFFDGSIASELDRLKNTIIERINGVNMDMEDGDQD
ncbi:MAG: ATP synthase F1 subunit delta [bacterium]